MVAPDLYYDDDEEEEEKRNSKKRRRRRRHKQQEQESSCKIIINTNIKDEEEKEDGTVSLWWNESENDPKAVEKSLSIIRHRGDDNEDYDSCNSEDDLFQRCIALLPRTLMTTATGNRTAVNKNSNSSESCFKSSRPTRIQELVWKSVLSCPPSCSSSSSCYPPSCVILAPTASGKTLAYGALLLLFASSSYNNNNNRNNNNMNSKKKNGLVLVPTRELAVQVTRELQQAWRNRRMIRKDATKEETTPNKNNNNLDKNVWDEEEENDVEIVACYGGVDRSSQIDAIQKAAITTKRGGGVILVGTPGRLGDLLLLARTTCGAGGLVSSSSSSTSMGANNSKFDTAANAIHQVSMTIGHVVVDEADRMALQTDLCQQVDALLMSTLSSSSSSSSSSSHHHHQQQQQQLVANNNQVSSIVLASATMPARVKEKWDVWIRLASLSPSSAGVGSPPPPPAVKGQSERCVVVRVGSMTMKAPTCSSADNVNKHDLDKMEEEPETAGNNVRTATCESSSAAAKAADPPNLTKSDWLAQIPGNLTQVLHVCSEHKKPRKFIHTLKKVREENKKSRSSSLGIVFFNTIKKLHFAANILKKEGVLFGELHSHMNQKDRERTVRCFQSGRVPLLLASDVAARGMHVEHVGFVINYDFPGNLEQYVHRCGRAGRRQEQQQQKQRDGKNSTRERCRDAFIYSFFTRNLAPMASDLVHLLRACRQDVDPNLLELVASSSSSSLLSPSPQKDNTNSSNPNRQSPKRQKVAKWDSTSGNLLENEEDEDFMELSNHRIVLKRASHVSDASSSSSSSSYEDDD